MLWWGGVVEVEVVMSGGSSEMIKKTADDAAGAIDLVRTPVPKTHRNRAGRQLVELSA
jgi:hypothetical protein